MVVGRAATDRKAGVGGLHGTRQATATRLDISPRSSPLLALPAASLGSASALPPAPFRATRRVAPSKVVDASEVRALRRAALAPSALPAGAIRAHVAAPADAALRRLTAGRRGRRAAALQARRLRLPSQLRRRPSQAARRAVGAPLVAPQAPAVGRRKPEVAFRMRLVRQLRHLEVPTPLSAGLAARLALRVSL